MIEKKEVVEVLTDLSVFEKPVWDNTNNEIEVVGGYKAIRMNRDDSLVRIVSSEYQTIQHIDAFNQTVADLDKLNLDYQIRQMYINDLQCRNNKRSNSVQITFEFPELNFNVDGSKVGGTLELFNSNDASLMFSRKFGAYRHACNNIMCIGKNLFHERFKHVGSNSFGDLFEAIEGLPKHLKDFSRIVERTMSIRIDNVISRGLIDLGFPARLIDNLEIASEKYADLVGEDASSDQLWGVYQILTNWLSNVVTKTNIQRADKLGEALYRFISLKVAGI